MQFLVPSILSHFHEDIDDKRSVDQIIAVRHSIGLYPNNCTALCDVRSSVSRDQGQTFDARFRDNHCLSLLSQHLWGMMVLLAPQSRTSEPILMQTSASLDANLSKSMNEITVRWATSLMNHRCLRLFAALYVDCIFGSRLSYQFLLSALKTWNLLQMQPVVGFWIRVLGNCSMDICASNHICH